MSRTEAVYQEKLIGKILRMLPDAYIIQNDPQIVQGIPDLLILIGNTWAMLEVKASKGANIRPNQPYYVELFDQMSFAAFIYPENEEEVLNDLQSALRLNG